MDLQACSHDLMDTVIYKFGGASVRSASAVRNLAKLVSDWRGDRLIIVISAMGKTTNALEDVLSHWYNGAVENAVDRWRSVLHFHQNILEELFSEKENSEDLRWEMQHHDRYVLNILSSERQGYNADYDRIIPVGELLSTRIVSAYLNAVGTKNSWVDIRQSLVTDGRHREAHILWSPAEDRMQRFFKHRGCYVTQGFIGADENGTTTTLGREGSDYSAAALAYCLRASRLIVWKDVTGIFNGDPRVFSFAEQLDELSFDEAIELAYFGATVIHPRTIQPLKKRNIPLEVRSFAHRQAKGTLIHAEVSKNSPGLPCYIQKKEQVLIRLSTRDLSFMAEHHLGSIYRSMHAHLARVNFSSHSAISANFALNADEQHKTGLFPELEESFDCTYSNGLTLYTIRHPDEQAIKKITEGKEVILSQHGPNTYQVLLRE